MSSRSARRGWPRGHVERRAPRPHHPRSDGHGVASVFDVVHDAGGTTALFAGKDKFATFDRSWPEAIDEFEVDGDADALVDEAVSDLTTAQRRFTFLHLELPDAAGHASGWMSPAYLDAVAETDRLLGELLDTIDATPRLSKRLVIVLTADHGGMPGEKDHDDASDVEDYKSSVGVGPRDPARRPLRAQPRLRSPAPAGRRTADRGRCATVTWRTSSPSCSASGRCRAAGSTSTRTWTGARTLRRPRCCGRRGPAREAPAGRSCAQTSNGGLAGSAA